MDMCKCFFLSLDETVVIVDPCAFINTCSAVVVCNVAAPVKGSLFDVTQKECLDELWMQYDLLSEEFVISVLLNKRRKQSSTGSQDWDDKKKQLAVEDIGRVLTVLKHFGIMVPVEHKGRPFLFVPQVSVLHGNCSTVSSASWLKGFIGKTWSRFFRFCRFCPLECVAHAV
jgi:hypothetical protein